MATDLTDSSVLELSERITSEEELMNLGVKGLRLPQHKILQAITNNKRIQSAAHDVLSTWFKQQTDRHEAYTDRYRVPKFVPIYLGIVWSH